MSYKKLYRCGTCCNLQTQGDICVGYNCHSTLDIYEWNSKKDVNNKEIELS